MAGVNDPLISASEAIAAQADGDGQFIDAIATSIAGLQPVTDAIIPGSIAFDIDMVKDAASLLPHMLPRPDAFNAHLGNLGIATNRPIIVYDRFGQFCAPRVWWMLRAFGIASRVLDGGMLAWLSAGGPAGGAPHDRGNSLIVEIHPQPSLVADFAAVNRAINDDSAQIVDVRSAARFAGNAPEPRAGLACGHMPGAINAPYNELLNDDGTMKTRDDLHAIFAARGIDLTRPIITSCGSGVTACITALALARLGVEAAVYDGSWAEWGSRPDAAIVAD